MILRKQRFLAAAVAVAITFSLTGGSVGAAEIENVTEASVEETAENTFETETADENEEMISEENPKEEAVEEETASAEEEPQDTKAEENRQLQPLEELQTEDGIYGEYGTYSMNSLFREYAGLYADVPETFGWRYEAIKYVTEHGIMNGISGTGKFAPDDMMNRAMFAAVIYRMDGSPTASYVPRFPDVPGGNYFSAPISWANSVGIITGHSNTGLFGTYENITREDMVTVLYRYAQFKGRNTAARDSLTRFSDADQISGYAKPAMQWAVANGIITGRTNTGKLDPKGYATRVECAAIIQRFGGGAPQNPNTGLYTIMGKSSTTVAQMVRCYNANAWYPDFYSTTEAATIEDFCRIFYEEAAAEGVKAEVAFCQAMKETGWLRFGGDVGIEQFNFAGIGATGNGAHGNYFESPRIGIRAQIQHLKAYASSNPLNQGCVDPRFQYVARGCAPYVEWLGIRENPYGKGWATSPGYGYDVVKRISNLKKY